MCALANVIDSFLPFCHSDSFVARIDVIFPFVVAWKRARKVDNESLEGAYISAPFFAAIIRQAYMQWCSRHLAFLVSRRISAVCDFVLLATLFILEH